MSHPDGLPELFLDRSLGRKKVPELLRAEGLRLITLAEHYGIPDDEAVEDVEWLQLCGERGWFAVMKDDRIRYVGAERRAPWSSPASELPSSRTPTFLLQRWRPESSVHLPTSLRYAPSKRGRSYFARQQYRLDEIALDRRCSLKVFRAPSLQRAVSEDDAGHWFNVYAVRVVTNTVQHPHRRFGPATRKLKAGCTQLGLRCQVNTFAATVAIEGHEFEVKLTERASKSLARGLAETSGTNELLVAQRITEDARTILRDRNVSFFDERGYLSIHRPPLVVEASVTTADGPSTKRRGQPLDGIGLDVALWLLHSPEPGGVRAIGRAIGRTASSVSDALRRLVDEGLVTAEHEPLLPELFDAAVQAWRYRTRFVSVLGDPATAANAKTLRTRLADASGVGWAWAGPEAERAWKVPGIRRSAGLLQLLVPDADSLDLATSILKADSNGAFDLTVAPVAWLASRRVQRDGKAVVPAIVVALDLALDDARGRELLDGWNPEGVHRVW